MFKRLKRDRTPVSLSLVNIANWYQSYLPEPTSVELVSEGRTNDVFRIVYQQDRRAYLKVYNDCFEGRAETELSVRALLDGVVPVPPIIHRDFSLQRIPRKVIIFDEVHGRPMNTGITRNQMEAVLSLRLQMNTLTSSQYGLITPDCIDNLGMPDPKSFLTEIVDAAVTRNPVISRLKCKYDESLRRIALQDRPTLVHQAFNHKHIFFEDDRVTAVIDWEAPAYTDPHVDYASLYLSLQQLCAPRSCTEQLLEHIETYGDRDRMCLFVVRQLLIDVGFKHGDNQQMEAHAEYALEGRL